MPRLAPRIGVSLLVTLLFGPLSSTAHDLDDKTHESEGKRSELMWAVLVEGQCASNQYCFAPAPGYLGPATTSRGLAKIIGTASSALRWPPGGACRYSSSSREIGRAHV